MVDDGRPGNREGTGKASGSDSQIGIAASRGRSHMFAALLTRVATD
jgi:hypothetical protein